VRKQFLVALALLTFAWLGLRTASAQLAGDLKILQPAKPASTPAEAPNPQPDTHRTAAPPAAQGQVGVNVNSLRVNVRTANSSARNSKVWNWVPNVAFNTTKNLASGDQLYFEAAPPGGPAMKADCHWEGGDFGAFECGGNRFPEEQGSTYTGPVNIAIKLHNELQGTDATLFSGVMKVAKGCAYAPCTAASGSWAYYVGYDWALPIGNLFYDSSDNEQIPSFKVAFWVRGGGGEMEPHLFYQGKEIGLYYLPDGRQAGRPSCSREVSFNLTQVPQDVPGGVEWARMVCSFPMVIRWDKRPQHLQTTQDAFHLAKNPGDYEFKLLWRNKLARTIKFKVGADGDLDNGIVAANNLNTRRTIVPVTVIGDLDGPWDRNAWKTDAFFGHPLKGFTWPPQ
jgi:hypothetical protein